uniref:Uncharacterized protein n=2 Tax=Oryza sativa subsp. japonica TaxID=39947 RepID=Q10JU2_ORYSJ|nr:hypothetical protein [Oryza sativa Japonica Group]ABF96534.1 hypothetical protein LOC_Os03g29389 [Oryza sativa Japonica Group]
MEIRPSRRAGEHIERNRAGGAHRGDKGKFYNGEDRKMECRRSRGCGSPMNIKSKAKVGIDQGKESPTRRFCPELPNAEVRLKNFLSAAWKFLALLPGTSWQVSSSNL